MKTVYLVSAHGKQRLSFNSNDRIIDILSRYNISWAGVNLYVRKEGKESLLLSTGLERQACEFAATDELHIVMTRNINPFPFQRLDLDVMPAFSNIESTEFFFREPHSETQQNPKLVLKKLSPEECIESVSANVHEVLDKVIPNGAKMVLGVSGGGDSNALLTALGRYQKKSIEIHGVIIKGIPEWDKGVPRAQALCDEHGIKLTVVDEDETRALLNIAKEKGPLVDVYERYFPGDDFEFLGTLMIRMALMKKAKAVGAEFFATGINLEDYMSECFFRLINGKTPLPAPVRPVGDMKLVYPLWMSPKKIIDGCYPKLSLENYNQRYPCYAFGRSLYYEMALQFTSSFPGGLERLAQKFGAWGQQDFTDFEFDQDLGFHVMEPVSFPLKHRLRKMMNG